MSGTIRCRSILGFVVFLILFNGPTNASSSTSIPTLEDLRIKWPNMPVRAMPVVQNFVGATNLGRRSIVGLGPITLGGFNGNMVNSTLTLNGISVDSQVSQCEWQACEGVRVAIAPAATVRNSVRMVFEERVVVQKWEVELSSSEENLASVVALVIDGPFFSACDEEGNPNSGSCGWGISLPIDRKRYSIAVSSTSGAMSTKDTLSKSSSFGVVVPGVGCSPLASPPSSTPDGKFEASLECHGHRFEIWHVFAVAESDEEALSLIQDYLPSSPSSPAAATLSSSFSSACSLWQSRWLSSFSPSSSHFSGNLPTLTSSSDPALAKLYYWSALALVSLERVSMRSFARQFVISEGASNSYNGDAGMGGSGQFLWDHSFSAASLSLLEPEGTRLVLQHVVANADFRTEPVGVPQAWDSYLPFPSVGELHGHFAFSPFFSPLLYLELNCVYFWSLSFQWMVDSTALTSSRRSFTSRATSP